MRSSQQVSMLLRSRMSRRIVSPFERSLHPSLAVQEESVVLNFGERRRAYCVVKDGNLRLRMVFDSPNILEVRLCESWWCYLFSERLLITSKGWRINTYEFSAGQ